LNEVRGERGQLWLNFVFDVMKRGGLQHCAVNVKLISASMWPEVCDVITTSMRSKNTLR